MVIIQKKANIQNIHAFLIEDQRQYYMEYKIH